MDSDDDNKSISQAIHPFTPQGSKSITLSQKYHDIDVVGELGLALPVTATFSPSQKILRSMRRTEKDRAESAIVRNRFNQRQSLTKIAIPPIGGNDSEAIGLALSQLQDARSRASYLELQKSVYERDLKEAVLSVENLQEAVDRADAEYIHAMSEIGKWRTTLSKLNVDVDDDSHVQSAGIRSTPSGKRTRMELSSSPTRSPPQKRAQTEYAPMTDGTP